MAMEKRTKVNSKQISENFPEYYQELFSECEIVPSSADSFFWTGEYVRFYGGLTVFQKLPTKVYVGLEITPEPKVSFAEKLVGFSPHQNSFSNLLFEPAKEQRLISFLNEYLKTLFVKGKKIGFKIHILSEAHCGGGLGSTGVIMTCLATAILLLYNKIRPSDLEEISSLPVQLQIQNHQSKFNQIFRLAWRLTAIPREGQSSGATSFGAMLHTFQPMVFVSENIEPIQNHPSVITYKNQLENCQIFEKLSYWGASLGDIFGLKESIAWPIDIARIWSGSMINTENILKSISRIKNDLQELRDFTTKTLAKKLNFDSTKEKPFFYLPIQKDIKCESCWQYYIDVLNFSSLKIILGLGKLFREGASEAILRDFFDSLCNAHNLAQYLGTSTPILDHIYQNLMEEAYRVNETVGGGVKLESIGKGGHVLFVFPPATLWQQIDQTIAKLRDDTKKEIWLDWASWIDGYGNEGISLEQYIGAKIFSKNLSPDSIRLSLWQKGQLVQRKIISVQEKEHLKDKFEIVLDSSENKISFCGNTVTSRKMPSSSATIAILALCLKSGNSAIKNKDLPSAYGQSRYDLQSKIALPFSRACQKYCQKKTDFTIHGGMYDDYSLYLEPNNLEIVLIEPLTGHKK